MALLTISAVSASSVASGVQVTVELTDFRGDPVSGFRTDDDSVFIGSAGAVTDALGVATFDLTPNSDITPTGTFYTVRLAGRSFLILKSGAPQTLLEAVAAVPAPLGQLLEGQSVLIAENNLSDLENVAEARDNLELGDSATLDVGTTAGTVAAGDDPRFITSTDHSLLANLTAPDSHPATAISYVPTGSLVSTNVQAAVNEVYGLAVLSLDDASEINFVPTGTLAATNVQSAINELDTELATVRSHPATVTDAHDASAISFDPTGTLYSSVNVQDAIEEVIYLSTVTPIDRHVASAGTDAATFRVVGDPYGRFIVNASGLLEWSDGTTIPDTNLFRASANVLKTDDVLAIAGNTNNPVATSGSLRMINTGSVQMRNAANSGNVIALAVDAADDTFLNANTGDEVHLSLSGVAKASLSATRFGIKALSSNTLVVSSDTDSTTAAGGIAFGSSLDTNLYRSASNVLKTDDAFIAATSIATPFLGTGSAPAASGELRLSNDGMISWRNQAGAADIPALWVNTGNDTVLNAANGETLIFAVNTTAKMTISGTETTYADGQNVAVGTTTGTKYGTSTSQKLGFYNATPVTQRTASGASGFVVGAGTNANSLSTWTGGVGATAYTVGDIVAALKTLGFIAS